MLKHKNIKTKNFEAVKITIEHKIDIFNIFSNPKSIRFTDNDLHLSVFDSENLIKKYEAEFENQKSIRWGIKPIETEQIIGIIGFYHIDFKHKFATLGCLMSDGFQGRRIMPEIQNAAFNWIFSELGLHRIEAQCFTENIYSKKNLESVGFVREGRLKQNFLINGKFEDSYIYGLINPKQ